MWVYVEAARRGGLAILPPCVNRSDESFVVEDGGLRVGLGRLAGLPAEFLRRLLAERRLQGRYESAEDLRRRLRPGSETFRLLARAGALDGIEGERRAMLLNTAWKERLGSRPEIGRAHV